MADTQDALKIKEIIDDIIFLKDGSATAVLKTSAVNFGLLSDIEQYSIIESFAGLLNSLSFPIQIVIRSERMDVSSYLLTLEEAQKKQTNPLLLRMIKTYRAFVESMIKENDVLDKQFYVCVTVSALELGGLLQQQNEKVKKASTILIPRLDHLIRQLGRTGLKARQLNSEELVTLFYTIYNNSYVESYSHEEEAVAVSSVPVAPVATKPVEQPVNPLIPPVGAPPLSPSPQAPQAPQPNYQIPRPQSILQQAPIMPTTRPVSAAPQAPQLPKMSYAPPTTAHLAPPFIVEELKDEYGP